MIDSETTSRIHDPEHPNNGTISVRVMFTMEVCWPDYEKVTIIGIFRLDNDAEIDYKTLSKDDQRGVEDSCVESTQIKNKL